MNPHVPHLRVVVGFCLVAIIGYAVFSGYAVFVLRDPALSGDVIGTWKSFAVLAFGFWLGSSSGGKAKDKDGPVQTHIVNAPNDPVPTTTRPMTAADLPHPTFGPRPDNPDGEQR